MPHGTTQSLTITTLESSQLPADVNLLAGWSSAGISMSGLIDALFSMEFVSASANRQAGVINAYIYAALGTTPTWPDIFSAGTPGVAGAATVRDARLLQRNLKLLQSFSFSSTSAEKGSINQEGIARLFEGLIVPSHVALFLTGTIASGTAVQLANTGNFIGYTPIT